jgi:hypothetical protein
MSDAAARNRERPISLTSSKGAAAVVRALKRSRRRRPEIEAMRALHLRIALGGFFASMITVAVGCARYLAQ